MGGNSGDVSNCYVTGSVTGGDNSDDLGGLCGDNYSNISNCYVTGSVTGGDNSSSLGGLCGYFETGNISNCYATGSVTGGDNSSSLGGLCGFSDIVNISNCFWDVQTSGQDYSDGGGTGLPTSQLHQQSTFTDWDFINVWNIVENQTYPYLRTYLAGDINKDHINNFLDLNIICNQWMEGVE
jgi:hypothetical protein